MVKRKDCLLKCITCIAILISTIQFYHVKEVKAYGNVIYVNASGGANYRSIQEAINSAEPGDTIYVYPGTYNENLIINKTLTLQGYLSGDKIINGAEVGNVISVIDASYVNISDFIVQNPVGQDYKCIMLNNASYCSISNNLIRNGCDGFYLLSSHNNFIYKNTIERNDANGIYLSLSNSNKIYDNTIRDNEINGICVYLSSNNEIYRNTISGNKQYGLRFLPSSNNNIIYLNTFSSNSAANAQDTSTNFWDYNYKGNYWDDYNNYDNDKDGIGDVPYNIPGGNNKDNYPLGFFLSVKPLAVIVSVTPNPAVKGDEISFDGKGIDDGYIVNWEWSSSIDGLLSKQEDFTTSSLSIGSHTIRFRVQDNDGQWSDYASIVLTVTPPTTYEQNKPPTATIVQISPQEIEYGETVYMSGSGTDTDGHVVEYYWSSSIDGYLSDKQSFYISNLSIGEHEIYFKVKDNNNAWSSVATGIVKVNAPSQNNLPIADAGGPYEGYVNESILFNGSKSYDIDGYIVSYLWDFGDGKQGEGEVVEHKYLAPGTYVVNLTVIDNIGNEAVDTTYAIINESMESKEEGNKEDKIAVPGFELILFLISIIFATVLKIVIKRKDNLQS